LTQSGSRGGSSVAAVGRMRQTWLAGGRGALWRRIGSVHTKTPGFDVGPTGARGGEGRNGAGQLGNVLSNVVELCALLALAAQRGGLAGTHQQRDRGGRVEQLVTRNLRGVAGAGVDPQGQQH